MKIMSSNDKFPAFIDTMHSSCVMCENYECVSGGSEWTGLFSEDYPDITPDMGRFQLWYSDNELDYLKEDHERLKIFFKESVFEKVTLFKRVK